MAAVIHFINSFEDAKKDLGELLDGREPKLSKTNHVGTHDYSQPPHAVVFGRAFAGHEVKELNRLYRGHGAGPVAWIAGDPEAVLPKPSEDPNYAEKGAESVKRAFARWKEAGSDSDDVVLY